MGDSVTNVHTGSSDDSLTVWKSGRVVTVDYRRITAGFWSGNPGSITRITTMPGGLRPRREIRVPMVGDVYFCVGSDGFIGIFNYGESKTYALGFGAIITYALP